MPTAITKSLGSEGTEGGNGPREMEAEAVERAERGSATETDDSNRDSDSDMDDEELKAMTREAQHFSQSLDSKPSASKDEKWMKMLEELKRFHDAHGTLLVPFDHRLFRWWREQSALYQRLLLGEDGLLSPSKIAQLKSLGIDEFMKCPVHKLSDYLVELCWLGERSRNRESGQQSILFDWDFIRRHASKELLSVTAKRGTFTNRKNTKLPSLVGRGTPSRFAFDALREDVRAALDSGMLLQLRGGETSTSRHVLMKNDDSLGSSSADEDSDDVDKMDEARIHASLYDSDDSSSVNLEEAVITNAAGDDSSSSESDSRTRKTATPKVETDADAGARGGLNAIEEEVAWLGEESMVANKKETFDWNFIRVHASAELKRLMDEKEIFTKHKSHKMFRLLGRIQSKLVKMNFDFRREEIRKKLAQGYRRPNMKKVLPKSSEEEMGHELGTGGLSLWQDTSTLELTPAEEDLAWLLEEQASFGQTPGGMDWEYIKAHASPLLKRAIAAKKVFEKEESSRLDALLRSTPGIKEAFEMKRIESRKKLSDGYTRRDGVANIQSSSGTPKTPDRGQKSLTELEIEVAFLGEESMFFTDSGRFDWDFIKAHASPQLAEFMKKREIFTKYKNKKLPKLVRMHDEAVNKAFMQRREEIRKSLAEGKKRKIIKKVLPKLPGKKWKHIFATNFGGSRKRTVDEAGLDNFTSDEVQDLTDIQDELLWLSQESQFATGAFNHIDWKFVEKHASEKLREVMREKKEKNTKHRTIYAYFNLQSNPRLRRSYEKRNSEIRDLLVSGHRRKRMRKVLPHSTDDRNHLVDVNRNSSRLAGSFMTERKSVAQIKDGFVDGAELPPLKGYERGKKVLVRCSSGGNEWKGATLLTYVDVKTHDDGGGHRRQYKIQFENRESGWVDQSDVKYHSTSGGGMLEGKGRKDFDREERAPEDDTSPANAASAEQSEASNSRAVYKSVMVSLFPPNSYQEIANSKQTAAKPEQELSNRQKMQKELGKIMTELRFQRENYRQELKRQEERFEAHVSFMEKLEQKAMDIFIQQGAEDDNLEDVRSEDMKGSITPLGGKDDDQNIAEASEEDDKSKDSCEKPEEGMETDKLDEARETELDEVRENGEVHELVKDGDGVGETAVDAIQKLDDAMEKKMKADEALDDVDEADIKADDFVEDSDDTGEVMDDSDEVDNEAGEAAEDISEVDEPVDNSDEASDAVEDHSRADEATEDFVEADYAVEEDSNVGEAADNAVKDGFGAVEAAAYVVEADDAVEGGGKSEVAVENDRSHKDVKNTVGAYKCVEDKYEADDAVDSDRAYKDVEDSEDMEDDNKAVEAAEGCDKTVESMDDVEQVDEPLRHDEIGENLETGEKVDENMENGDVLDFDDDGFGDSLQGDHIDEDMAGDDNLDGEDDGLGEYMEDDQIADEEMGGDGTDEGWR